MAVGHVAIGALRMRSSRVKKCSEAGLLTCRIVAKCPLLPRGPRKSPLPQFPATCPSSPVSMLRGHRWGWLLCQRNYLQVSVVWRQQDFRIM